MARAAKIAGMLVYENSEFLSIEQGRKHKINIRRGTVFCEHVVLACDGYIGNLSATISRHVMPINNFVVATEPLGVTFSDVLTKDIAVTDTKFVVNYFRKSHDGSLLFGGGENYNYKFPQNIEAIVRKPMLKIFPHLKDREREFAWGGTLAITMRRLPLFRKLGQTIYSALDYSGRRIGTAVLAGEPICQAIDGDTRGFDLFAKLPSIPFPGGR